jgi:hypothetical protein
MHLNHEDFVLHYYGETPVAERRRVGDHLAACDACSGEYARLRESLALVDQTPPEEPGPGFEREVWARLQPHLTRTPWWRRGIAGGPISWAAAGAVAATIAVAFLGGWLVRDRTVVPAPVSVEAEVATERILLVAMGEHLERSQMLLVELMNGEDGEDVLFAGGRDGVADLVAANRLYRQSAAQTGDGAMAEILDELERVLVEIANAPPDEAEVALAGLRERVERRGILFRVRVLTSEMRAREQQSVSARQRSES